MRKPSEQVNWLPRHLYEGPYLTVIHSQAQFNSIMRRMGIPKEQVETHCSPSAGATTHTYYNERGKLCCIIAVNLERIALSDCTAIEICGLLVHEATHVWQQIRKEMTGAMNIQLSDGIGIETEAYFMQALSVKLMDAYYEQYVKSPRKAQKRSNTNRRHR